MCRQPARWWDGDTIEIELPMHASAEGLPDGSDHVALMHGPLMLCARNGTKDLARLIVDDSRGSHAAK